ncbi:ATP-binding protein [Streptomyces brasiliensis]|uniref:ATPase n=1 Tax=Streptomyces brasiliensis TaxID=1954 RepID=A0A917K255_9ACTN|nr:hypothetical protein [Streptomyces brasiliensis]GGI95725.1 hypothetical protein GCM10010121_002660 [Streptomyces brasiliensis]
MPDLLEPGPAGLVGRAAEETLLRDLLTSSRLVTVTGAAGVGKSRIAATVAAGLDDGPWRRIVPVRWQGRGLAEPGDLAAETVRALTGRRTCPRRVDVTRALRDLPGPDVLLFLDDADPVHTECVGLVQRLLMAVPEARVLVTSRRALGLGAERVLRLAPLDTGGPDSGGEGGVPPAVEMFMRLARAAVPGFRAEGADLRAVTDICRTLEGVPLAIELAAGQTVRHPVTELAGLLERHQCWLGSTGPVLRRHRSLREAVGAGYVLCERPVRVVWGRASIFEGSFSESTAAFLCAGGGVSPDQVPSCLARLVAAGVLRPLDDPGGVRRVRYRMSRAAREFGLERLAGSGEFPVAAERRVLHCRRVAEVAENLWGTGCQRQAVHLVRDELDDLAAMIRHALTEPDHAEAALRCLVDLWFWWVAYDNETEGRDHLLRLLPLCESGSPTAVRALWLAAWLTASADPRGARVLLGRAWPAAVLAGDNATIGRIAHVQGVVALCEYDAETAAEHFREAADTTPLHAPGGPSPAVSQASLAMVQATFAPRAARRSARRAMTHPGTRDDAWASLLARYAQAFLEHRRGHGGRARQRAHRALADLDPRLPAPHAAAGLNQLIADIETGTRGGLHLRTVPLPHRGVRMLDPVAGPATR